MTSKELNCMMCEGHKTHIEFLEAKISALLRSVERISGKCGAPDASDACRNILMECKRILTNSKSDMNQTNDT